MIVFYYSVIYYCNYVSICSVYEIKMENKKQKMFFLFLFFWSNWEFFVWNWEKTYFLALGMRSNFGPKIG